MTCQQNKCEQEATHTVYWPGQTTKQCETHAKSVRAMGAVLGFHVDIVPLAEENIPQQPEDLDE